MSERVTDLKTATKHVGRCPKITKQKLAETLPYLQADPDTKDLVDSLTPRGLARLLNVWDGTKSLDEMLIRAFVNGKMPT